MAAPSTTAIKTYRYLRLAMVLLVVMLGVALVFEWSRTADGCWQTSISAYYYTPVKGVFIGALVAIGACLVVLKGNNEWEDILLNTAGLLAPIVAFVPTPGSGGCRSVAVPLRNVPADIENNLVAYFAAGAAALVLGAVLGLRARSQGSPSWDDRQLVGIGGGAALLAGGVFWFASDRPSFERWGHDVAALTLFACIVAVVALNAWAFRSRRDPGRAGYVNRYSVIAALMLTSVLLMGGYAWLVGWDHAVLFIEGAVISLFAWFWVVQTYELWEVGLREGPTGSRLQESSTG